MLMMIIITNNVFTTPDRHFSREAQLEKFALISDCGALGRIKKNKPVQMKQITHTNPRGLFQRTLFGQASVVLQFEKG